jgi:outer membrane lipoprotein-sorting protein
MRFFAVSSCLLLLALRPPALRAEETPAAILEHTRSVYAALTSYSDTGTALKEYSPTSHDENSFATYFTRAPRHFLFDYRKPSGDRLVIWGDPDAFHVWWKTTGQVTEYPNPKNTGAITLSEFPTGGAITKIPPLLYSKGNLPGAIPHFEPDRLAGMEDVAGNKCYRLEGTTSDLYSETGKKVNVRNLTVWIDSTSYLIRKILEEAPAAPGMLDRTTTTFHPQANPKLNDDPFKFAPPK